MARLYFSLVKKIMQIQKRLTEDKTLSGSDTLFIMLTANSSLHNAAKDGALSHDVVSSPPGMLDWGGMHDGEVAASPQT